MSIFAVSSHKLQLLNDFLEINFIRIYQTDFHDLFHHMVAIWLQIIDLILIVQSHKGRAMATKFEAKSQLTFIQHPDIPKKIAISQHEFNSFEAPMIALHRVKIWRTLVK